MEFDDPDLERIKKMCVSELKDACRARKVTVTGNKHILIARLCNSYDRTTIIDWDGIGTDPATLVGLQIYGFVLNEEGCELVLDVGQGQQIRIEARYASMRYAEIAMDEHLHAAISHLEREHDYGQANKPLENDPTRKPLLVLEASLGIRRSTVAKDPQESSRKKPELETWVENHKVIGLRLQGMKAMGWIFCRDGEDDPLNPGFESVAIISYEGEGDVRDEKEEDLEMEDVDGLSFTDLMSMSKTDSMCRRFP